MKPRLLHTCIGRRARTARAPTQSLWRPLSLCWQRAARRAAPSLRRAPGIAVHHHTHSTLHLHLHLATPPLRAAAPARALMRHAIVVTPAHRIGAPAPSPRQLMLYRTVASDAQRARQVDSLTMHREPASAMAATIAMQPSLPPRAFAPLVARDAAAAARLMPTAPSTARARAVRPATLTMALAPRTRAQHVDAAVRTAALPAPLRQALIWQRPAPPAASATDPEVDADTAFASAAGKTASTPALAPTTAARTAAATQQLRETLGTKLLDGAFTDRLADDVIRRVEKRMRIERERRGL